MEAQRPYDPKSVVVDLFKYPDGPLLADGDVFEEQQLRIEAYITGVRDWPDRLEATEHWTFIVEVFTTDPDHRITNRLVKSWAGPQLAPHQNKRALDRPKADIPMNFYQGIHRLVKAADGDLEVHVTITGDVSKVTTKVVRKIKTDLKNFDDGTE